MAFLIDPFDALLRKFKSYAELTHDDVVAVRELPVKLHEFDAGKYLLREGEHPEDCIVLVSGYAYRQKLAGNGRRQILSLHVPGDPIDFQSLYLDESDHNVQALTRARAAFFRKADVQALVASHPKIARAIFICPLIDASISREWMLNVGRRDSVTALAHLLCEFAVRLDALGTIENQRYELPMTQEQIGDALGLTSVHVNRTMRALEARGLIVRDNRRISFPRWKDLVTVGDFSPRYLHLQPRGDLRVAA